MKNPRYWFGTECRASDESEKRIARGYAARFNSYSEDLGGFREVIRPGAFRKTLNDGPDIAAVWNHNMDFILGRVSAGTLILSEDENGLDSEIHFSDSPEAMSKYESIKRGDVYQMSFAFRVIKDRWTRDESKELDLRELLEVKLYEVSPVVFPAYPQTSIGVRSAFDADDLSESLKRAEKRNDPNELCVIRRAYERLELRNTEPPPTPVEPVEHSNVKRTIAVLERELNLQEIEI